MRILCIAIARGIKEKDLISAFDAAIKGGIKNLEITMNTNDVEKLIKIACNEFKGRAEIGAGTVITMDDLKKALDVGAQFIVSPITNIKMIEYCKTNSIPVYPGALTPTEINTAWQAGAAMVKVFPVGSLGGADYIKSIKGPMDSVKLLACGGVRPDNVEEYIIKGADGIAIGSQLFEEEWLATGEYKKITDAAAMFVKHCGR